MYSLEERTVTLAGTSLQPVSYGKWHPIQTYVNADIAAVAMSVPEPKVKAIGDGGEYRFNERRVMQTDGHKPAMVAWLECEFEVDDDGEIVLSEANPQQRV